MKANLVTDNIYMLSINVEDMLFEEMWEIPNGVAINSFIVKGEKTAIIDGVCGWDGVPESLFKLLDETNIDPKDIDYLIINHMEPDHSGWIEDFKKIKKDFKIYCTKKAADLLEAFYGHTENVNVVKRGDTLDLGGGKILEFMPTPNLHWPDTMFTYEQSSKTLFTCDMFGTFGKINDKKYYDDMMEEEDFNHYFDEEIRYYSNVISTYNATAKRAVDNVIKLEPSIIAPAHGPVYRKDPEKIINRYKDIINYNIDKPLKEITILWGSMYGMTQEAVEYAVERIEKKGITVNSLRMPYTEIGQVISKAYRSSGIIIGAPTYENKLFPSVACAIDEIGRKKLDNKKALYLGSYGWNSSGKKEVYEIIDRYRLKWEFIEDEDFLGRPREENYNSLDKKIDELISML